MFRKTAIITAALFTLLMSAPAIAATDNTSQIPELNPFCWHRIDCHNIRKQYLIDNPSQKDLESGFISDASVAPCVGGEGDDQWGRCLPAGTTKTEISFGGQDRFSNIGEFIVLMYKYLLTIASIVAVVVVIVAGVQWITSGGNSEAIGSAKKRIGGAVIGLFIAYMSYFVLNTINPALVNLRLPQVWLIKPQSQMTEFCSDIPGTKEGEVKFMWGADSTEQAKPITPETADGKAGGYKESYKDHPEFFYCGKRFFAENGGNASCFGDDCSAASGDKDQNCIFWHNTYTCDPAKIYGKISRGGSFLPGWVDFGINLLGFTDSWADTPVLGAALGYLCNNDKDAYNGHTISAWEYNQVEKGAYKIHANNQSIARAVQQCSSKGGIKGFVVFLDLDIKATIDTHETHAIGRNGEDLGDDSWYEGSSILGSGGLHLSNFFYYNAYKLDQKYFIQPDALKNSYRLDINTDDIVPVNNEDDRRDVYSKRYLGSQSREKGAKY